AEAQRILRAQDDQRLSAAAQQQQEVIARAEEGSRQATELEQRRMDNREIDRHWSQFYRNQDFQLLQDEQRADRARQDAAREEESRRASSRSGEVERPGSADETRSGGAEDERAAREAFALQEERRMSNRE